MSLFLMIITAGIVSLGLRIAPVLFLRNLNFNKFNLNEILDLASSCIIGQIIYCVAFNNKDLVALYSQFSMENALAFFAIICSFMVCYYTKSIMKAIFLVLFSYSLLLIFL